MAFEPKNKTSCTVNGITIIDPNDGQDFFDSTNNVPIQNEELNISVQLKTSTRGRTILRASGQKQTTEETGGVTISFIEGEGIGNKNKSLTTNYTLLTTSFDNNERDNDENFGITNINIEFDTAYHPMITINFVDIRGSAIFQNDTQLKDNKYRVLFDFPYPLYELTIKGYFGKPVKYCLHMTNFSSKFNSQTGNFEITAKFIGYTYAMLADMLLGYLSVINYTDLGKEEYKNSNIPTIDALIKQIEDFNNELTKLSQNTEASKTKEKLENSEIIVNQIKDQIVILGDLLETPFIKGDKKPNTPNEILDYYKIILVDNNNTSTSEINSYTNEIIRLSNEFNKDNTIQISQKNLNLIFNGITSINEISGSTSNQVPLLPEFINSSTNKQIIIELIKNKSTLTDDAQFNYIDTRAAIAHLNNITTQINLAKDKNALDFNQEIENISSTLNFSPTIKYITSIFTKAIETLLKVIYKVSYSAEQNQERRNILKKVFTDNKKNDYSINDNKKNNYYPWPSYYAIDNKQDGAYVEKYLGLDENIKGSNESKIDELLFVENLLNAFIEKAKQNALDAIKTANEETNWIPVNPADTRLFGIQETPYSRLGTQSNDLNSLKTLILMRAMTFLGYSNDESTLDPEKDIKKMAEVEANLLSEVQDKTLILALINDLKDANTFIKNTKGTFGTDRPIVVETGQKYKYNFIEYRDATNSQYNVLPIQNDFNPNETTSFTKWPSPNKTSSEIIRDLNIKSETSVFLTNYSSIKLPKGLDGGVYVKIFSLNDFERDKKQLRYEVTTDNVISLTGLKDSSASSANLNSFGGGYGIQEFVKMDFDDENLGQSDLKYMFYHPNTFNSICKPRTNDDKTPYDLNNNTIPIITDSSEISLAKQNTPMYVNDKNFGKIREFLIKNELDITYPFVKQIFRGEDELRLTNPIGWFANVFSNYYGFSLFGSAFYYSQEDQTSYRKIVGNYSKALLFLNTLPFTYYEEGEFQDSINIFTTEVLNLFNKKASFIHSPKLWCAYLGGLIWRNDKSIYKLENGKIIGGGSGNIDPINWSELFSQNNLWEPNRNDLFSILVLNKYAPNISNLTFKKEYDEVLESLPAQVKEEFKKIFLDFVNNDWENFKTKLEIHKGDALTFKTKIDNLTTQTSVTKISLENDFNLTYYNSIIINNISPDTKYFIDLELKGKYNTTINGEKTPVTLIIDALKEEVVIANTSYKIWLNTTAVNSRYSEITAKKDNLELYIKTLYEILNPKQKELAEQNNQLLQETFGTADLDIIKLNLYKFCKNINDKWVTSSDGENNIIYKCTGDYASFKKEGVTLLDSFRFVSRSFRDIGDDFYINPSEIPNTIKNNPNISFYNFYSKLLSDNNFDFIPLPTFINYRDKEELESVFKTFPDWYSKSNNTPVCGPTFICIYSGERSRALDLSDSANLKNDGFDFYCDGVIPSDFTTNGVENGLAVFKVNYGQQNQSIFKDIELDQSEFKETDESLKITSDLVDRKSENNRTFIGQNLYNVYNVRSYSAKVSMLGNPMIQPMMYFQLNNIPMFHGAYLITNVSHNIIPNHMTTSFTGQRIKYSQLPLVDRQSLFLNISKALGYGTPSLTNGNGNSYIYDYNNDLLSNTPKNITIIDGSVINKNSLTQRALTEINNWKNGALKENDGVQFLTVYSQSVPGISPISASENNQPWSALFSSYIMLGGDIDFPKSTLHYNYVTAAMKGEKGYEAFSLNSTLKIKAEVGDILCEERVGEYTSSHCDVIYKVENNKSYIVGGNISETIRLKEINLDNNFLPKDMGTYKILVKKTNNKYYNRKNLIGTGVDVSQVSTEQLSPKTIYLELKKQLGYPDEAIAGIMGNMYQESRFIPTATNKGDGGFGLVQWTNQRNTTFNNYISNNNLNKNSYIDQIKFLKNELDNSFRFTGNNLRTNNDVNNSAKIFYITYEAGSLGTINFTTNQVDKRLDEVNRVDNSYNNRLKFSNAFYDMIKEQNFYTLNA